MPAPNAPKGNEGLRQQTGMTTTKDTPQQTIAKMIAAEMPRIQRLIQNPSMTRRFGQLAMQEMRKNPTLFNCQPASVLACLMTSASLGLQLGVGGQAYLIPYKKRDGSYECTFVPGWKGYMTLMHRTGQADAQTGVVREGDAFRAQFGSSPFIEHERRGDRSAKITHFYAWGQVRGAEYPIVEVWTMADILDHRARFNKVGDKHYSYNNPESFEAYGRKVALLQVLKYLPASFEMEQAMELDGQAEVGKQALTPDSVIEGVITSAAPAEGEPEQQAGESVVQEPDKPVDGQYFALAPDEKA
jgi:recombination protein RecT